MDLHSYQPGRRIVLAAPRYNDPFRVSHAVRAMLLWPLLPLWLLYLAALGLRREINLHKPLWLRTVDFDGQRQRLVIRFGLWPLFVVGRKVIPFAALQSLGVRLRERSGGGVDLSCEVLHRGGTLRFEAELSTAIDEVAAMGLVKRAARVLGWRHCAQQGGSDGAHDGELTQLRLLPKRDAQDEGEPVSLPKRPRLGGKRKRASKAGRAQPTAAELATLRRASSWRVASWQAGAAIEMSKPWDLRALLASLFIVLPLSPVAAAFLLVGVTALVMFPPLLLDFLSPVVVPSHVLLALAAASLLMGMLAMAVDVVRGYLNDYGARRLTFDWDSRTLWVMGPGQRVALAFEDIEAVVVREPWRGELPEGVGYDQRPAIEIERRGASAPLRLVWIAYTRGHEPAEVRALAAVARAAARALGVPHRSSGFHELQTR